MKSLVKHALSVAILFGMLFISAHQTEVSAVSTTPDCPICYQTPFTQHYTHYILRYKCIYEGCTDTWWKRHSSERNDAYRCFNYFSSSYMSAFCEDHTTCGECGKLGEETHYDVVREIDKCMVEDHAACEGTRTQETSRQENSSHSCDVDEKRGYYICPLCFSNR